MQKVNEERIGRLERLLLDVPGSVWNEGDPDLSFYSPVASPSKPTPAFDDAVVVALSAKIIIGSTGEKKKVFCC